jgi:endonuclease YncB( thermonuclease family)
LALVSRWALLLALGAGLLCPAPAPAAAVWRLSKADVSLVEAGYTRDPKHEAWEAEVELRLVNRDQRRRFHQQVQVEFVDAAGKAAGWKTFVSLAPGTAQHRRVRAPARLGCKGPLEACGALRVRISLRKGDEQAALAEIPRAELKDAEAPPVGQPVYVGRVFDGDTFELLSGQKVRLLGVDTPERERKDGKSGAEPGYREASDFTRAKVMQGPVRLAFDGERRDVYGRWLALVTLEDGSDLNAELLRLGLARRYARAEFSRKADYEKLEAEARSKGLGLWQAR